MYLPFDRQLSDFKESLDVIDVLATDMHATPEQLDRAVDIAVQLAILTDHIERNKRR